MTRKPAGPPGPRDERSARAAALGWLARRDFSAGELRSKLIGQGFEASLAEALVEDLVSKRLVDDARFVEHFVSYRAARGQGPVRIGHDLKALGIELSLIERFRDGQDWVERARIALRRKFGAVAPQSPAGKAKQARFLAYRGFEGDQIQSALDGGIDSGD